MRAVFFDRDNTLTCDDGYTHKVSDFAWITGAPQALARLHKAGIAVFIITNQGGIAKGLFTKGQMQDFHDHLIEQAALSGGKIHDIAYCPHHPDAPDEAQKNCTCRKPSAELFFTLADKWHIDLKQSVMIGDKQSDVQAGEAAGCHSYLFDPRDDLDGLVKMVIETHFTSGNSSWDKSAS